MMSKHDELIEHLLTIVELLDGKLNTRQLQNRMLLANDNPEGLVKIFGVMKDLCAEAERLTDRAISGGEATGEVIFDA